MRYVSKTGEQEGGTGPAVQFVTGVSLLLGNDDFLAKSDIYRNEAYTPGNAIAAPQGGGLNVHVPLGMAEPGKSSLDFGKPEKRKEENYELIYDIFLGRYYISERKWESHG